MIKNSQSVQQIHIIAHVKVLAQTGTKRQFGEFLINIFNNRHIWIFENVQVLLFVSLSIAFDFLLELFERSFIFVCFHIYHLVPKVLLNIFQFLDTFQQMFVKNKSKEIFVLGVEFKVLHISCHVVYHSAKL